MFGGVIKVPIGGAIRVPIHIKPMRSGQDEDFHDIIAERYERKPTIITSNLDFSEWNDAFHNKLLSAATLDRIMHGAYQVVLDGKSYRIPTPEGPLCFLSLSTRERPGRAFEISHP